MCFDALDVSYMQSPQTLSKNAIAAATAHASDPQSLDSHFEGLLRSAILNTDRKKRKRRFKYVVSPFQQKDDKETKEYSLAENRTRGGRGQVGSDHELTDKRQCYHYTTKDVDVWIASQWKQCTILSASN